MSRLFLLIVPLLAGPAQAADCFSMLAARVADLGGVADCDTPLPAPVGQYCAINETPNVCAEDVYDDAELLPLDVVGESMAAKWIPPCLNGTDTCGTREISCYDGSRPMVYADKAVNSGGEMYSNGWVFYIGGEGKPCEGDDCWDKYIGAGVQNTAEHQKALSTYHPEFLTGDSFPATGIVSDQWDINGHANNFAHFNRIRFNRCTDGVSDGVTQQINTSMGTADLFHHGDRVWEGLIKFLDTADGRDLGGGGNSYADGNPDLPPLASATRILLAGSSDGSVWLIENADQIRDRFHAIAPTADVRIAVDSWFAPMLENEGTYNLNGSTSVFDGPFGNPAGELLPVGQFPWQNRAYNELNYNLIQASWDTRGVQVDATCLLAHVGNTLPCYDHHHVLLNHVATPFFIAADQRDGVIRKFTPYATNPLYRYTEGQYRARVVDQGIDMFNLYATDSEMGEFGTDDEHGIPSWSPALYLPLHDPPWHVYFGQDARFTEDTLMHECDTATTLDSYSPSKALHRWMIYDTAFDAWEDGRVPGTGHHWVTEPRTCGSMPQ